MLRIFFKYNRRLRGELCGCALRSLTSYFAAVWGGPHTIPFPNAIFPTIDEKTASPVDPGTTISTRSMLDYDLHGRRHRGRAPEVNFVRRPIAERFVRSLFVVEPKIRSEMRPGLDDRPIFVKIDLFVLDRTLKSVRRRCCRRPGRLSRGRILPGPGDRELRIRGRIGPLRVLGGSPPPRPQRARPPGSRFSLRNRVKIVLRWIVVPRPSEMPCERRVNP